MLLLDTNICVFLMKNKYPAATQKLLNSDPSEIAISSITLFELEYGAAKSQWPEKNRNNVKLFLAPFTIIPFDSNDAIAAGEILALIAPPALVLFFPSTRTLPTLKPTELSPSVTLSTPSIARKSICEQMASRYRV